MVKCVQLVGRLRDRATALFGGKIRIVVATIYFCLQTRDTFLSFCRIRKPRSRATTKAMLEMYAKIALRFLVQ